ncbi:methyltransferase [Janibacter sp. Soil728]|uniref:RsmB/NOP family class I SAM-dependent RNA methyltransferase n=1 Tax=Janibacter sp. Soil728 TaxID=1736393 RepID=UPI000700F26E|nr:transcription antitermination factor NusB [Janibacter sp. Soil728]KRE37192.1 methyltransferase [Janibacter sp. Soil728]
MTSENHHKGPRQKSRTAPSARARRADVPRATAQQVLRAVSEDGAYANLELPKALRRAHLSGRDAAFATELTYGTLRMQGLYDAVITHASQRPVAKLDGGVLDVLRMGAHQVLGMRVPVHAAADQSVALARSAAGQGAAGLVNAVMRRVGERSREEWLELVTPTEPVTERLSVSLSHPVWIVKALRQALIGHGVATTDDADDVLEQLLEAHNIPAEVSLIARPGLCEVDELLAAGAQPGRWSPFAAELDSGDPGSIDAIREGRAAVQDEGSQLLALALAGVPVHERADGAPERWLDLCAGPGGKAGLLAALALRQRADLVANELSEHRTELVRQSLRPAMAKAKDHGRELVVRTGDGREVGRDEPQTYDRVLVDAPCTGLGALRRRPEARWRRQPSDLVGLGPLQRELLAAGIDATRPGGVIAYATCSPHLSETTFVVRDVLKKRDDVEVLDAREHLSAAAVATLTGLGDGPHAQLWPHLHGTDGMFLALLRKTS